MKRKVAFKTLGCRLNQYETDSTLTDFINGGYEIVDFGSAADAYIINTCTVTNMSDHKSRQAVSQAIRRNRDAVLVVTGCMANSSKEILEKNEMITYVVENEYKGSIFTLLDSHFNGEILSPEAFQPDRFAFGAASKSLYTRSLIKIQDGCDNFCTFCIVPFVRGRAVSRPWKDIRKNIEEVLQAGFREIVLTGVNIGRYNFDGLNFELLAEKIAGLPGEFRIRITSIEPEGFSKDFFRLFEFPKFAPHLHMCLQSGSDKILRKMHRKYSVDTFREYVQQARSVIPDFNFTTDIMVGFPGEEEADFVETCKAIEEFGFSHVHTFKYSVRKGTLAAKMEGQVPEKVKTERSRIVREIAGRNKRAYRSTFVGKTQTALVEQIGKDGMASGYGEHYIPVMFKAYGQTKVKEFMEVEITGIGKGAEPVLTGIPYERSQKSHRKV